MTRPAPTVTVPRDDDQRPFSDSLLPDVMIYAGSDALDRAQMDMANYVSGETIDWDQGMIAVAVYRAMIAAALQAAGVGEELNAAEKGRLAAVVNMLAPVAENNETVRLYGKEVSVLLKALRAPSREPVGGAANDDQRTYKRLAQALSHHPTVMVVERSDPTLELTVESLEDTLEEALPLATREEAPAEAGEIGWLVESDDNGRPLYHTASRTTRDASEALRFSRKRDAEAFIAAHGPNHLNSVLTPAWRAVEHRWG